MIYLPVKVDSWVTGRVHCSSHEIQAAVKDNNYSPPSARSLCYMSVICGTDSIPKNILMVGSTRSVPYNTVMDLPIKMDSWVTGDSGVHCSSHEIQADVQINNYSPSPATFVYMSLFRIITDSDMWDPGSALFKYCKYTRACTKRVLLRTSMYKMYVQETYCY